MTHPQKKLSSKSLAVLGLKGCRKWYFFIFVFFIFPNFKLATFWISKVLTRSENSLVLIKFYYVTNIFDLKVFDSETTVISNSFEICTEMRFVSLFFLNERNIATSLLMTHLKYSIVRCANLNSSSINKLFLSYGPSKILFCFFRFLINVYFNNDFVKNFMKKLSFFTTNFQNSFQDVV